MNLDGEVAFADFLLLAGNFGESNAVWGDGDLSLDGSVGFEDFLLLVENFGKRVLVV